MTEPESEDEETEGRGVPWVVNGILIFLLLSMITFVWVTILHDHHQQPNPEIPTRIRAPHDLHCVYRFHGQDFVIEVPQGTTFTSVPALHCKEKRQLPAPI